ncbi:MAG: hypothetical protein WBM34_14360 [Woeseiaceae bacterium]
MKTKFTGPCITTLSVGLSLLSSGIAASDDEVESSWQCVSGNLERDIVLYRSEFDRSASTAAISGLACRVVYTKNGASEVLWQAHNDPDYCEPRVRALVEKLKDSGFVCTSSDETFVNTERDTSSPVTTEDVVVPAPVKAAPVKTAAVRTDDFSALRGLLEKHYEDSYLDAMVLAIPAGFSVSEDSDAVYTESGGVLHLAPPNHFVKTMSDGSYVLVNTLLMRSGSTSSFVNLGFAVRDSRYRFLGYAIAHSAVEVKVLDADSVKVALMVSQAANESCEASRRMRTLQWAAEFSEPSDDLSREVKTNDCGN